MREIKLQDLKVKSPTELLTFAEGVEVENASTMRKQELMFAILKQLAARETGSKCVCTREARNAGFRALATTSLHSSTLLCVTHRIASDGRIVIIETGVYNQLIAIASAAHRSQSKNELEADSSAVARSLR